MTSKIPLSALLSDSFVQGISFFMAAAAVTLLAPTPDPTEVDNINFIYDFMNESINISQAKFLNFFFLAVVYVPTQIIKIATPSLPNSHMLVLWKLIFAFLSTLAVSLSVSQVKRVFGRRTADALFVLTVFSHAGAASKLTIEWACFNLLTICVAFWISSNMLGSLACALLCLPTLSLDGRSLSFLLAFSPLFVNANSLDFDPLAVFSYLCTTLIAAFIDSRIEYTLPEIKDFLWSPNAFMLSSVLVFTASRKSSTTFKLLCTFFLGSIFCQNRSFVPFLLMAAALSASVKDSWFYAWFFRAASLALSLQCATETTMSVMKQAAGPASFYFNPILHANLPTSAHVSSTAMSLGFSKMAAKTHPQLDLEFGTEYQESEMLERFQFRVTDVNDYIDAAYWKVYHVQRGWQDGQMRPLVKILIRRHFDY